MTSTPFVGMTNWAPDDDNQYMQRLMHALSETGITVEPVRLNPKQIAAAIVGGMRVLHIHWPEFLVHVPTGARLDTIRNVTSLVRFALSLMVCRVLPVRVVWTVHNLQPHDASASWAAHRAYDLLARVSDVFVVHSRAAAARTESVFPRAKGRVVVAPHGNYLGAHPLTGVTREELRAGYGIPSSAFLLLAFGQVRQYKRLVELSRVIADSDGADVHLLIAGAKVDRDVADELIRISAASGSVHADLRRIPGEQVSGLYQASDAAIINYAELFSSGALLLGLSQGLPVIAAHSDAALEVGQWPAISTYKDVGGLLDSVRRLDGVSGENRRTAALSAAKAASWTRVAETLGDAYALGLSPRR